jgi:predicted dinucleotide-binding enzyme
MWDLLFPEAFMRIGIIGAGNIGSAVARKLATAGHSVKLANSKGAESISTLARDLGTVAVSKEEAVTDVDVVILSIPFAAYAGLTGLFRDVPDEVTVIDTSNYYPFRDGSISAVESGMLESVWVSAQIGRPVVKAWNAVLAYTLSEQGQLGGTVGRIAVPVAGDDAKGMTIAMQLVNATGFDAIDAGKLEESWRQQPGTPAYCTELTAVELVPALAAASKGLAPVYRDVLIKEFMAARGDLTHEVMVMRNREATTGLKA